MSKATHVSVLQTRHRSLDVSMEDADAVIATRDCHVTVSGEGRGRDGTSADLGGEVEAFAFRASERASVWVGIAQKVQSVRRRRERLVSQRRRRS